MTADQASKPVKSYPEMIRKLKAIADGTSSPSVELQIVWMAALGKDASDRVKRLYSVLRKHFMTEAVKAPDGHSYKLLPLQRDYLRYVLVERYHRAGATWEDAYANASEYLSTSKVVAATTVRDSHAKVKKLLQGYKMVEFCKGLEYEFPLALDLEGPPPEGTFVDPEFLSGE